MSGYLPVSQFSILRRRFVARKGFLSSFSHRLSRCQTGKPQQTLASVVERSGTGLHSGVSATVRLLPARAGEGRYFALAGDWVTIPATIDHVVESQLCTTLRRGSTRISTVEHLMSALEGSGVDNVRIEIERGNEVFFTFLVSSSIGRFIHFDFNWNIFANYCFRTTALTKN